MSAAHEHSHAPTSYSSAFAIGIALNTLFVAVEAFYGWKINSLALLADAGHNLSDVAGLILAWGGALAGRLRPDDRHTYGWKRATILAAFINAMLLLVAMGSLAWEAIDRLNSPQPIEGVTIMVVAGLGIVINTVTALLFMRGSHDLNIRGAFLHMVADALVSAGVVAAGGLALWLGWDWLDPVVSLATVWRMLALAFFSPPEATGCLCGWADESATATTTATATATAATVAPSCRSPVHEPAHDCVKGSRTTCTVTCSMSNRSCSSCVMF